MKLFQLVMWRMSTILVVILTCWAVLFYLAIMEEVNDEVDDSLSDYSESLIIRSLSGEQMPDTSNGSNNQYFLYEVTLSPQCCIRSAELEMSSCTCFKSSPSGNSSFKDANTRQKGLLASFPTICMW